MDGGRNACQSIGRARVTSAGMGSNGKIASTTGVTEKSNAEAMGASSDGKSQAVTACAQGIVRSADILLFVQGDSHDEDAAAAQVPLNNRPANTATKTVAVARRCFRDQ